MLTNGLFFITAFTPTNNVCDFGGMPTLFSINAATGSAPGSPVLDIDADNDVDSADVRSGQLLWADGFDTSIAAAFDPQAPLREVEAAHWAAV